MTTFVLTEIADVGTRQVETMALGVNAAGKLTAPDIGKPVKLAGANNVVLCSAGDDIEGILDSVEPHTVNDGYGIGGVQRSGRRLAMVDAAQAGSLAVSDLVVSGAPAAVGTADTSYYPKVKGGAPTNFKWRVLRIVTSDGSAGSVVLIEKI